MDEYTQWYVFSLFFPYLYAALHGVFHGVVKIILEEREAQKP
jgi:hypothetical protein